MRELEYKESWTPKNWGFWTVVSHKTLKSPLDCKEIKPVNPKGNQPWIFIGRTDAEAEAPVLGAEAPTPDVKHWLLRKDPDAGTDWRQEEKGSTEDQMIGWHHRLNGPKFAQAQGDDEGQESLVCCSSWGYRVRHDWATKEQVGLNVLRWRTGSLFELMVHSQKVQCLDYKCNE